MFREIASAVFAVRKYSLAMTTSQRDNKQQHHEKQPPNTKSLSTTALQPNNVASLQHAKNDFMAKTATKVTNKYNFI